MGYDGEDPLAELVKGSAPYTALYTQILKVRLGAPRATLAAAGRRWRACSAG